MRHARPIVILLVAGLLAGVGCGDDSEPNDAAGASTSTQAEPAPSAGDEQTGDDAAQPPGTEVVVDDSEFGPMLFDANGQAIYIFENDSKGKTVCYDECAAAWPPVFTDGDPKAGKGVEQSLLGTVERRDGKLQVTYAGKPLYYYAHEEPGEVRCHNIHLNGGFWWVIGPDGQRRPA